MKDKGHFHLSLIKSAVRIVGCMLAGVTGDFNHIATAFIVAEIVGIAEEFVNKR